MVVNVESVSGTGFDHTGKRTSQNKITGFKANIEARKLAGKPGNSVGRVIKYGSSNTRFLDHAIAMAKCRHPAHVDIQWPCRQAADNHRAGSRVVGHAIQHAALLLGFRVDPMSPAVDNLKAGHDIVGCTQDVKDSAVRTLEPPADDKAQLTLDPRLEESGDRD